MSEISFLFDFVRYLLKYKKLLFLSVSFIALDVGSELIIPILIKVFIDIPEKKILYFSLLLLLIAGLNSLARYFSIYFTNKVGQNILHEIRTELFSHIIRLKPIFFDRNQSGKLVIRVTNDVENLNELFVSGLITFIADILIIFGIIIVMFNLNFKLALVSCAVFPFMIYVILFFRKRATEIYLSIRKKIAELNSFTAEVINGIKTVKIIPAYIFSSRRFRRLNEDYSEEVGKAIILFSFFFSSIIFFSTISLASAFIYGGISILKKEITFGTFVAFWYALNKLYDPIWDFSEKYNIFQFAVAAAKRIKEIMNEEKEGALIIENRDKENQEISGKIEFKNVFFSYDGRKDVLKGVSFKIEPGEKVSIVGITGSGKTTIANLLTRMYEPQSGQILLDDKDIKSYPLYFVRRKICFVHQDIFILSGTVLENITLGKYDERKINEIEKIIEEFGVNISLSRKISQDGVELSSGEKQIVSILRAIYHDPKIIIFDEATAFIDFQTEEKISHIIENMMKDKVIIKIAHRISTALSSEKIILIKEGKAYTYKNIGRQELMEAIGL